MNKERFRSSDPWEVAALWALGYSPSHAEAGADQVDMVFPEMGEDLDEAVRSLRSGVALVNPLAMKQGYHHARNLIRSGLDHAAVSGG